MTIDLGPTGIWSLTLRYGDQARIGDAAAELESLGYSALWFPDVGGEVFAAVDNLLRATRTAVVATGILNLWMHSADETAARHAAFSAQYGRRFMLGVGVGHAERINQIEDGKFRQPMRQTELYLDALDAAETPVPRNERMLAALGPKMLELTKRRTAGSHPFHVIPEHTAAVRAALGPDAIVAPEQAVLLETDAGRARRVGRALLERYLPLSNYTNNWRRVGFTDDDFAGGGSDRLVDAMVVWGDESAIAARVQAHRDAGADHVCIQVLDDDPTALPLEQWRRLAPALIPR